MLTRLKLLRLQREMMETREKKMLEMREKKMVESREKKIMSTRETKKTEYNASKIKGNRATFRERKARHQGGYFGKNSLILIELHQNNLQRESQRIKNSICQWKQHAPN